MSHIKGAKVRFVHDPNNPSAPPRRVIEKMGFWERVLGPKDEKVSPYLGSWLMSQVYYPPPTLPVPATTNPAWTQPRPLPSTIAPAQAAITATNHPSSTTALRPTPFPLNFRDLPRSERHAWEKQRKEELKFLHALDKEQGAAMKAENARLEKEAKIARQKEKEELKSVLCLSMLTCRARKKAIKLEKKLGYRPMPQYIPPTHRPLPPTTVQPATAAAVPVGPGQPTSWMLLPTLEQFGVRRPFDAPGKPRTVDIGGTEWPMMSRTMTHAIQDMSYEERVRLDQAGHTWSPAWYRD